MRIYRTNEPRLEVEKSKLDRTGASRLPEESYGKTDWKRIDVSIHGKYQYAERNRNSYHGMSRRHSVFFGPLVL